MSPSDADARREHYVPAVSERLRKLLHLVIGLFALLAINAVYLASVTLAEWSSGVTIQNYFYQYMFLSHLLLGFVLVVPLVVFGALHIRNARKRPNRLAVRAGLGLFASALVLVGSGILLVRLDGFLPLRDPGARGVVYWAHVVSPLVVLWLFILHRLAGPPLRWKAGLAFGVLAAIFAASMVLLHRQDPRQWSVAGPDSGEKYFEPSLARTATGQFIPADVLTMDAYCQECHPDVHKSWSHSMHRFSSFNNPAYLFSVRETRRVLLERDGNTHASRFCAGCHDPVPFFSGAFDEPAFDAPDFDVRSHPTAAEGITCTVCHAITHINSVKGNAAYTIEEPEHYPFTTSTSPLLRWVNRQLIKAKPALHKKTFLKPLHRTPEFCSTCHKVHLPKELNHYKWLRGQNHYDSYHLSGVSGHGVASFYYPTRAEDNCNGCHMELMASDDFGATPFDGTGIQQVHNHLFPSANTAIPHLLDFPDRVEDEHRRFLEGSLRVDLFGIKEGGTIDGKLTAPAETRKIALRPGGTYLLEVVVRTLTLGHHFTQGTADSNQVWLEVTARAGERLLGQSGGRSADGSVDPWAHFINAYILDRDGNRIDRRNAQDIFVPLYNHQIPPGAADVIHYRLRVPEETSAPVTIDVKLQYRKFDTTYMRHVHGDDYQNDLPIVTIATDTLTLPASEKESAAPLWVRWNDYGIGLLRKGDKGSRKGELRQAEEAFREVERLGHPEGPLNLARVYIKEGRLEDAVEALRRAAAHDPPAAPWSVAWFTGIVNKQNGHLDDAIENFLGLVGTRFPEARARGFDFGEDYRLLNELGKTFFERAKRERHAANRARRSLLLHEAVKWFEKALAFDPENVTAHYNLGLLFEQLGEKDKAERHRSLHGKYKLDDNARERAVAAQRSRNPAADHAAEAIVIYDLERRRQ